MKIMAECVGCQLSRQIENIKNVNDTQLKLAYIQKVCEIMSNFDTNYSSPVALSKINKAYLSFFGEPFSYEKEKREFDEFLLSIEDNIRSNINNSQNRLLTALKYASAGNLIDFGIYKNITPAQLTELLSTVEKDELCEQTYNRLISDLQTAKELVYLTDNCGESVLDKLLIETIISLYPSIKISIVVRGEAVLNDVTENDARRVGLDKLAPVISNGTGVPGTQLDMINEQSRAVINSADVIISKGQGNFETLQGCGLNIYYILLCKCELFTRLFKMERNSKIFAAERTLVFPAK